MDCCRGPARLKAASREIPAIDRRGDTDLLSRCSGKRQYDGIGHQDPKLLRAFGRKMLWMAEAAMRKEPVLQHCQNVMHDGSPVVNTRFFARSLDVQPDRCHFVPDLTRCNITLLNDSNAPSSQEVSPIKGWRQRRGQPQLCVAGVNQSDDLSIARSERPSCNRPQ